MSAMNIPALLASASGSGLNPVSKLWLRESAKSTSGHTADELFMWIFWFDTVCFVVLMGLMVYWVVKYRRRPGKIAAPSPSHNTPLEIAWTVLPLVVLAYIFFKGFHGYINQLVAPAGAYEINIEGAKWNWTASYQKGESPGETTIIGTQAVPIMYVPAEHPVRLKFKSVDVLHAFWVPDFRVKQDVVPNRYTSYWFQAEAPSTREMDGIKAGTLDWNGQKIVYNDHWAFCAEYCGTYHSEMAAIIRVVPKEYFFNKWLPDNGTASLPPWDYGERIYKSRCASCHSVDGTKNTGPTWKDLWGHPVEFADGSTLDLSQPDAWENYVRESVFEPSKRIVKGFDNKMNSFAGILDDKAIRAVTEYMKSPGKRPEDGGAGAGPAEGATPAAPKK
jgi:cytochrome c oxidase subunit 2